MRLAPYYKMVPKDFSGNLAYRRKCLEMGNDRKAAEELWIACARDLFFFVNTFAWIYEPRTPKILPFITYGCQDEMLLDMLPKIGRNDIGIEKSRDMGCTWICLTLFTWRCLFQEMQSFLCVSRTEDLVDKTADPDSLFWKIDFLISNLPKWMTPQIRRTNLHIEILSTRSVIDGASTTGNVGRGGRRTAILMDEFGSFMPDDGYKALAATQSNTNTRIFLSTPQGAAGAYYDVMHPPEDQPSDIKKIRLHWSQHPLKSRGLYTSRNGRVEILDKDYWSDDGKKGTKYPFIADGKLRSPWYDKECRRSPLPQLIAQELDIDYLGSGFQFFDQNTLDEVLKRDVRPPYRIGELEYDPSSAHPKGFLDNDKGPLKLWTHVDAKGSPPKDRSYVIGADIATGSKDSAGRGASNSVLSIGDKKTGEKVGEYAISGLDPIKFARVAVAMARWFGGANAEEDRDWQGAYLIWEANGPGRLFGEEVISVGYRNIFYRRKEDSLRKRVSDIPGWFSTRDTKLVLLGEYRQAMVPGDDKVLRFINRSKKAIQECRHYVVLPGGAGVVHSSSVNTIDPTSARENHGDRVIADALCWKGMKVTGHQEKPSEPKILPGSFAWRQQKAKEQKKNTELW